MARPRSLLLRVLTAALLIGAWAFMASIFSPEQSGARVEPERKPNGLSLGELYAKDVVIRLYGAKASPRCWVYAHDGQLLYADLTIDELNAHMPELNMPTLDATGGNMSWLADTDQSIDQ